MFEIHGDELLCVPKREEHEELENKVDARERRCCLRFCAVWGRSACVSNGITKRHYLTWNAGVTASLTVVSCRLHLSVVSVDNVSPLYCARVPGEQEHVHLPDSRN